MGAGGGRGYGGTEPAMDYHHTQGGGGVEMLLCLNATETGYNHRPGD